NQIYIGNQSGAESLNIPISPDIEAYYLEQQKRGNTAVFVTKNKAVMGVISIADQIRHEAPMALAALRKIGIHHTVMLTGDNKSVAKKVGDQLEINRVFASLLPED